MDPTSIEVDGAVVRVSWEDDRTDVLSAGALRAACPCAGCREPAPRRGGDGPVEVRDARLVGGYAVNFVFAPDGHATGIFSFSLLRSLGDAAGTGGEATT